MKTSALFLVALTAAATAQDNAQECGECGNLNALGECSLVWRTAVSVCQAPPCNYRFAGNPLEPCEAAEAASSSAAAAASSAAAAASSAAASASEAASSAIEAEPTPSEDEGEPTPSENEEGSEPTPTADDEEEGAEESGVESLIDSITSEASSRIAEITESANSVQSDIVASVTGSDEPEETQGENAAAAVQIGSGLGAVVLGVAAWFL